MSRQAILAVMDEWPIGAIVWHKANGVRGVIQHYLVTKNEICVGVDYGVGQGESRDEYPDCLSATKLSTGDGDEWKEATA